MCRITSYNVCYTKLLRGSYLGEYHAMGGRHAIPNKIDLGLELHPVAFRDPIIKQLHSEVS